MTTSGTQDSVALCHYCGDIAATRDHVRPRSQTALGSQWCIPVVPACRDCNCVILRALPLFTNEERGQRVAAVLGGRLLKLGPPKWTEEEANLELEGGLRNQVIAHVREYHLLRERASWASKRWTNEDCWVSVESRASGQPGALGGIPRGPVLDEGAR